MYSTLLPCFLSDLCLPIDPPQDLYLQSEESDYDRFSKNLTDQRRLQAVKLAPAPTVDVVVGQMSNTIAADKGMVTWNT